MPTSIQTKAKAVKEAVKPQSAAQNKSVQNPVDNRMVMPAVSAQEALEAWQAYQELKSKIIDPEQDIQMIRNQEFKKKSYWRKVATFFNLSLETREEWKETLGRTLVWHFTVRATAPNGRYVDGVGSCDVYEKATLRNGKYMAYNSFKNQWEDAGPNSPHNTRSTAYTRAFNRAVSDLIGGGEVSAEEVQAAQQHQYESRNGASIDASREASVVDAAPESKAQGQFKCEKCEETIPLNAMIKSRERYDNHIFCFKHQLEYKKTQLQAKKA